MREQFYLDDSDKIKNIFDAPKGYFEEFPERVSKRIQKQKKRAFRSFTLNPKYALTLASVVILLVVGGIFWIPKNSTENINPVISELSSQEISDYLLQEGIHEHDLLDFYLKANITEDDKNNLLEEEILDGDVDLEEIEELL